MDKLSTTNSPSPINQNYPIQPAKQIQHTQRQTQFQSVSGQRPPGLPPHPQTDNSNLKTAGTNRPQAPVPTPNQTKESQTAPGLIPPDRASPEQAGTDSSKPYVKTAGVYPSPDRTLNPVPTPNQTQQSQPQGQSPERQLALDSPGGRELVDYATRCAAKLDPLSQPDMHMAKVAAIAVADTRESLPYRGNVGKDLDATDERSAVNMSVVRDTTRKLTAGYNARLKGVVHQITKTIMPEKAKAFKEKLNEKIENYNLALPMAMKSGNCGEFSALTARNVVGNLSPGQSASQESLKSKLDGERVNHAVAKIHPSPESDKSENTVFIADAWANGAPVRDRDAPSTIRGDTDIVKRLHPKDGPRLAADLDERVKSVTKKNKPAMTKIVDNIINEKRPGANLFNREDPNFYSEIQTTSREFEAETRTAAESVNRVSGPRDRGQAAVVGETNYDEAISVNNMVPQMATEFGVDPQEVADLAADAIYNAARMPPRPEEQKWVNL